MNDIGRAILAASQARQLCLSLQHAFVGPPALARMRAGEAASLSPIELRVGLGLAWAAGDLALVRTALASLPADRVDADAVLATFRDAAGSGPAVARDQEHAE